MCNIVMNRLLHPTFSDIDHVRLIFDLCELGENNFCRKACDCANELMPTTTTTMATTTTGPLDKCNICSNVSGGGNCEAISDGAEWV
jgi:hypothetical protein